MSDNQQRSNQPELVAGHVEFAKGVTEVSRGSSLFPFLGI
jgi:hypothetical protein